MALFWKERVFVPWWMQLLMLWMVEEENCFVLAKDGVGFDVDYQGKSSRLVFSSFQHFLLVMFVLYWCYLTYFIRSTNTVIFNSYLLHRIPSLVPRRIHLDLSVLVALLSLSFKRCDPSTVCSVTKKMHRRCLIKLWKKIWWRSKISLRWQSRPR